MNAGSLLEHYARIADAPDAIARLRRFVLDLAVRGKLVEQDPNDQPASNTLCRLSHANPAEGKVRRNKAAASNVAEIPPYPLPNGWHWLAFGEVHRLIRGVTYSKSDVAEEARQGYVPVLRANNIATRLTHDNPVYVKQERVSADQLLKRGDFLIAMSSGSKNLVGKACPVPEDYDEAFGGFCGVIRLHDRDLEGFTRIYLTSSLYRDRIAAGSRGIGINNLKVETVAQLPFPLPPLAEQHRIVAKVDELMALCDQLEAARAEREAARDTFTLSTLAKLNTPDPETFSGDARFALANLAPLTTRADQIKQLRQTILNFAVLGKLVGQDAGDEPSTSIIEEIDRLVAAGGRRGKRKAFDSEPISTECPAGWHWTTLSSLAMFENGDRSSNYPSGSDIKSEGVPFISTKAINNHTVSLDAVDFVSPEKFASLRSGKAQHLDILITLRGSVGKFGLFSKTDRYQTGFINAQLLILRCLKLELVPFVMTYMRSDSFAEQIRKLSSGSATPQLSAGQLALVEIPLPPLAEQHRIVAKVDELMALCDQLEASLADGAFTRAKLLDAVLHKALEPA